jgi:hypothetical protein
LTDTFFSQVVLSGGALLASGWLIWFRVGKCAASRTSRRAEIINQAILRYQQQKGQYPQALSDLIPGTMIYLPTPFIIPHQGWCYQGGPDYYRLGYVSRNYFSTPAAVKIYASVGQPPDPAWPCDAEAEKYPAAPGYPDS